ncbi:hypothetical protein B9G55_12115 [Saccharibacillus sp. O16]|nr:hypothetical protein B9G55_12115 [Saccharibacillus sp. O16]
MIRRKWRKRAKKKTVWLGLVGMVLLIALTGCSTVRETMSQLRIYGSNELIAESGDSYSYKSREGTADAAGAALDFRQFTGKHTLWTVTAEEDAQLNLELDLGVVNGKCKVVHILPNGEVVKLADKRLTGESLKIDLPQGKNVIKLVGKKAYGSLKAELNPAETATIQAGDNADTAVD